MDILGGCRGVLRLLLACVALLAIMSEEEEAFPTSLFVLDTLISGS